MGEQQSGSMCSTELGPDWIDEGTMCRQRSNAPGPTGLDGGAGSWPENSDVYLYSPAFKVAVDVPFSIAPIMTWNAYWRLTYDKTDDARDLPALSEAKLVELSRAAMFDSSCPICHRLSPGQSVRPTTTIEKISVFSLGMAMFALPAVPHLGEAYSAATIRLAVSYPRLSAVLAALLGVSARTRESIQKAMTAPGPTVQVATYLARAPQMGRALSVAAGEGAEALARAAARPGDQLFSAEIPRRLIFELERAKLVEQSITKMGDNIQAIEYRFLPAASEFIVPFFNKKH